MLGFMPIEWKFLDMGMEVFIPMVVRKRVKVFGPHTVLDAARHVIRSKFGYEFVTKREVVIPYNDERVDLGMYETFLIT